MTALAPVTASSSDESGFYRPHRLWVIPLAVLGAVAAATVTLLLLMRAGILPGPPGGGPYPFFWPLFPLVFPLGFLAFWLIVIFVVRPWSWGRTGGPDWSPPGWSAREIVRERYARGEISREQMASMLRDLDESAFAPLNPRSLSR